MLSVSRLQVNFQSEIFSEKTITQMSRLVRDKEISRVRSAQVGPRRCWVNRSGGLGRRGFAGCLRYKSLSRSSLLVRVLCLAQSDLRTKLAEMDQALRDARDETETVRQQVRVCGVCVAGLASSSRNAAAG